MRNKQQKQNFSRREFVQAAAAASFACVAPALSSRLYAAGSDVLKVGLIG
jgi:hypothetical protein